jgi:prepilin-type N-terminal cleavage/methylation domain-containing protein
MRVAERTTQPRQRGFTLLELLIVVVVFSIIVTASVSILTVILGQRRTLEQTMSVYDSVGISTSLVEFDAVNAGWRFPAAAFAVRVVNNVTASTAVYADGLGTTSTTQITTAGNCAFSNWGLVPGSDILELAEGYAPEAPGVVQFVSIATPSFVLKGATNPLTSVTGSAVLLFSDSAGNACMGKTTAAAVVGGNVTFSYLAPDFSAETSPATRYVSKAGLRCPQKDMNVYRLGKRTRYLLCKDLSGVTVNPALFRQVSDGSGSFAASTFQQIQGSIADLQVAPRVFENGSTNLGPASACTVVGTSQYCYCNLSTGCTGSDGNSQGISFNSASATITNAASHLQWVRGLMIGVTAASPRVTATGQDARLAQYLRPALLDHVAATGTGTGYSYVSTRHTVALKNIVLVTP